MLWRASPVDKLKEYQLNTITYEMNCAPYLALRVLKDIADQECGECPSVQDTLMNQTYVDDIYIGADSSSELPILLRSDLQSVLKRISLDLKNGQAIHHLFCLLYRLKIVPLKSSISTTKRDV